MTTAVYERAGEFGLRRAIGGRRVHVTALVLVESLIVGLVGGILGAYTSVLAILAVTLARGWQPVLDPRLLPLGLAGGILVGMLGGALATWRASRIEPSDALRA
nr:ABC transporter permease [Actinomyces radicidentis]